VNRNHYRRGAELGNIQWRILHAWDDDLLDFRPLCTQVIVLSAPHTQT
jgi:hypothetical protein